MKKHEDHILICGVNWLGDACMSMPAIQLLHAEKNCRITMLSKPALIHLWNMHPAVSSCIPLDSSIAGMWQTAKKVQEHQFSAAYIFPNSWRSALIPFMAKTPHRIGLAGHHRRFLLTEIIHPQTEEKHQQWEYIDILKLGIPESLPAPHIIIPKDATEPVLQLINFSDSVPLVGMLPGAARGPSKQWPPDYYISAAKIILKNHNCHFIIMGTAKEQQLCRSISDSIGEKAISIAGKTSLPELAATLKLCKAVICNDSGGMHLAAATGTPVIAIFGLTDASKTGPLGKDHQVIQAKGVKVSRKIARDSEDARTALRSVSPQEVAQAAINIIAEVDAATNQP